MLLFIWKGYFSEKFQIKNHLSHANMAFWYGLQQHPKVCIYYPFWNNNGFVKINYHSHIPEKTYNL